MNDEGVQWWIFLLTFLIYYRWCLVFLRFILAPYLAGPVDAAATSLHGLWI